MEKTWKITCDTLIFSKNGFSLLKYDKEKPFFVKGISLGFNIGGLPVLSQINEIKKKSKNNESQTKNTALE